MPSHSATTVRFEDVEADPLAVVEQLYADLRLRLSDEARQRMVAYLDSIQSYRKNQYRPLPLDQQRKVDAVMGEYLHKWGYETPVSGEMQQAA